MSRTSTRSRAVLGAGFARVGMARTPVRPLAYVGACLAACAVYFFLAPPRVAAVIYDGIGVAAAIALLVGARTRPPGQRIAWYLLAAGMAGQVGGDIYWTGFEMAGVLAPYPSWADLAYLSTYPLWATGLMILARQRAGRADRMALIDSAIVTCSAALLAWVFLIEPQIGSGESRLSVLTSAAYPVMDLLLLSVLVRLLLGTGGHTTAHRLLLVGTTVSLIADVTYMLAVLGDWYSAGSWIDLGWLMLYTCWGAAALSPSPDRAETPSAHAGYSLMWRLTPFATAAAVVSILIVLDVMHLTQTTGLAIGVGAGLTFGLIGVRVGMMFRTIERDAQNLSDQGRTLQRALDELHVAQVERTRLLDRTVRATEEERARVAVELHDGPIQRLTALSFRLGRARARIRAGDLDRTDQSIELAEKELGEHIGELRRLMTDLRPPALDEGGLEAALCDQIESFRARSGADVTFEAENDRELHGDAQVVLYRIAQEALANVTKHAQAHRVRVSLSTSDGRARLEVTDDGVGFHPDDARMFAREGHFGLAGMAQRASMIGGELEITSSFGGGTSVLVTVPARCPS
jgi:signal transduction histidine kinase